MRGATPGRSAPPRRPGNFNPRTPCGVRLLGGQHLRAVPVISIHAPLAGCDLRGDAAGVAQGGISIHAPLAGCDPTTPAAHVTTLLFQSTHPLRGATVDLRISQRVLIISIHAPLAGCDPFPTPAFLCNFYFNPRTPCGVRPTVLHYGLLRRYFNPRTPCGVRLWREG